jgi:nucleotide-binding universal stress UspA family protein
MARAVTIHKTLIEDAQRAQYLEHLRHRREHFARANCNFWVFEEAGRPGSFVEFAEAKDADALVKATAGAPGVTAGIARVYQEVEIR